MSRFSLKSIFIITISVLCIIQDGSARVFTDEELRAELLRQGFPQDQLNDWVCLIMAESSMDTSKIGTGNSDNSSDHGLFQINDAFWCNNGDTPGKDCNEKCEDLRQDDITAASKCAQLIFSRSGFEAWVGWKNKCRQ